MNRLILIVLAVLCTRSDAATVRFGIPRVANENGVYSVRLDGCGETAISARLSLPVLLTYVPLSAEEDPSAIRFDLAPSVALVKLETDIINDQPTALDPKHALPAAPLRDALPGRTPISIDLIETPGGRYARIILFPVTTDSTGILRFHETVTLNRGDSPLAGSDLLPPSAVDLGNDRLPARCLSADAAPDYVIITSAALAAEAQRLAAYKTSIGITAAVVDIASILAAHSGRDDAERLREYLTGFHGDGGQYVLLVGDETVLPIRYAYAATATTQPDLHDLQLCDLYFADLTGDWDVDNDGVWGEPYTDRADWVPELLVGRLPFHTAAQLSAYTEKLIAYETLEGIDRAYLNRAFFFCSDEMRDYRGGQHALIAGAYPPTFELDTINGVEAPSGDNPAPTNGSAADMIGMLSEGYGIVNILAHGRPDAFGVRTAAYNEWPKSYIITEPPTGTNAPLDSLAPNDRVGLYYSLACDNGGFDQDAPPFVYTNPNLVASALAQPHSGAVAFVAYSRWGWVGMSHYLQRAFFDTLFAHPDRPAAHAMARSKLAFPYYKDLAYGQNFYGDPSLRIYTGIPDSMLISIDLTPEHPVAVIRDSRGFISNCTVIVSTDSGRVAAAVTDNTGRAPLRYDFSFGRTYTIAAATTGHNIGRTTYTPSLATDTDDPDDGTLPSRFTLNQNFPNPFNPSTAITFDLPRRARVVIEIYDIAGRQVRTLADRIFSAGSHIVTWDSRSNHGTAAASGVYLYRMSSEDFVETRKMVLLH